MSQQKSNGLKRCRGHRRRDYVYDNPETHPNQSIHWNQYLNHNTNDRLINDMDELKLLFLAFIRTASTTTLPSAAGANKTSTNCTGDDKTYNHNGCSKNTINIAVWNCILGYAELLTTHSTDRYSIFPLPIDALTRLVHNEFINVVRNLLPNASNGENKNDRNSPFHRDMAKAVSNNIWNRVSSKKDVRDEKHANSLYVCLIGGRENRSLDCFGAALCTVIGLNCMGFNGSILTLSEDHAYESHTKSSCNNDAGNGNEPVKESPSSMVDIVKRNLETCEVAVPGKTLHAQKRRGREISCTFDERNANKSKNDEPKITSESSWLYMYNNAMLCDSTPLILAAAIANINCSICSIGSRGSDFFYSKPLYVLKRELLWILYDEKHLDKFPFALMEFAECEEHVSSSRGMEESVIKINHETTYPALKMESLYSTAISISQSKFRDKQVYPYCYPGHYHKDAGNDDSCQEYRLVEALRLYSEAARVSSSYIYDAGDNLQLTRVILKLAEYTMNDILQQSEERTEIVAVSENDNNSKEEVMVARKWNNRDHAVAATTWIIAFFDYLFLWEEYTGFRFLPILTQSHKYGIGKMFNGYLQEDIRRDAVAKFLPANSDNEQGQASMETSPPQRTSKAKATLPLPPSVPIIDSERMKYYTSIKSKRLSPSCTLLSALAKKRVVISDMDLAIILTDTTSDTTRSSKRRRKVRNFST